MILRKGDLFWILAIFVLVTLLGIIAVFPRKPIYLVAEPEIIYVEAEPEILVPSSEFMTYVGDFKITAYCPCEKCCEGWAVNRPQVYGKDVVFTASGAVAREGVTVAVVPEVFPYGTKLYIEGVGVRVAQDTGGALKPDNLEVYFNTHEDAWNSGLNDRPRKVWLINEKVELLS
jgi:3D (Asp-Asp-Asp) domain-containing protein